MGTLRLTASPLLFRQPIRLRILSTPPGRDYVLIADSSTAGVESGCLRGPCQCQRGIVCRCDLSPSSPTIDDGQSVNLTANPSGGSERYAYQWFTGPSCDSPIFRSHVSTYSASSAGSTPSRSPIWLSLRSRAFLRGYGLGQPSTDCWFDLSLVSHHRPRPVRDADSKLERGARSVPDTSGDSGCPPRAPLTPQ